MTSNLINRDFSLKRTFTELVSEENPAVHLSNPKKIMVIEKNDEMVAVSKKNESNDDEEELFLNPVLDSD